MEGSGRMVVVSVGSNSQVGNIMSLLGATEGGKDSKDKKKDRKSKTTTPSATKIASDLSKQSVKIEDETKPTSIPTTDEYSPLRQPGSTQETNVDVRDGPTTNEQGGMAKLAADAEDNEEENPVADSKHKCNKQDKF